MSAGERDCGCQVRLMLREEGEWPPSTPPIALRDPRDRLGVRIVYCPTHAAAFRLADLLAEALPFLGVEFPMAEEEIRALEDGIAAVLQEIGR